MKMIPFTPQSIDLPFAPNGLDFDTIESIASKYGLPIFKPNDRNGLNDNINVNIWVIRNSNTTAGKFDDYEIQFWFDLNKRQWIYEAYAVTADPSDIALEHPVNPNGTAIIAYGFHHLKWQLGFHKGRTDHPALVQCDNLLVYRDTNMDKILDYPKFEMFKSEKDIMHGSPQILKVNGTNMFDYTLQQESLHIPKLILMYDDRGIRVFTMEYGMFGINNHRASAWHKLENVGLYSEGCIVHSDPVHYKTFIETNKRCSKFYGSKFSITVLPISEFK